MESGLQGSGTYTYQWLVGYNGNAPTAAEGNALFGTTANSFSGTFNSALVNNLATGNYVIQLQVTDSATTPETTVSNTNALVVNPTLFAPMNT